MADITYLACPYTDPDPAVRQKRFEAVTAFAADLIAGSEIIYSPITHGHPITSRGLPMDWAFWRRHSREMLRVCSGLLVYCLPGWEASVGVRGEIQAAEEWGIPVVYCHPGFDPVVVRIYAERSDMNEPEKFDCFAVVEAMGHSTYAGRVSEQTIGGCAFVRVDVPPVGERPGFTKLLGQGAIFAITPCAEDVAKNVAAQSYSRPIQAYDPRAAPRIEREETDEYDEEL